MVWCFGGLVCLWLGCWFILWFGVLVFLWFGVLVSRCVIYSVCWCVGVVGVLEM